MELLAPICPGTSKPPPVPEVGIFFIINRKRRQDLNSKWLAYRPRS
jgi:hypothetical protein